MLLDRGQDLGRRMQEDSELDPEQSKKKVAK
jgi:hypothetical protein